MLEDTLKWRLEYLPDQLRWEDVQGEAARGKVYLLHDADEEGRPVVFMRPRKEEYGGDNDKRVQYVVYIMEQASRLADAHGESCMGTVGTQHPRGRSRLINAFFCKALTRWHRAWERSPCSSSGQWLSRKGVAALCAGCPRADPSIIPLLAAAAAPDGKMTWLLDHVGYNRKNQPPWKVSLLTLQIVQNHYPERLGRAVNFQPPFLFELFWKAIRPFVDPVTRDKVVFVHQGDGGEISKYVDLQHLDDTFGGPLPEDGMLDLKAYAQRMGEADARHQARLAAAAAELGV